MGGRIQQFGEQHGKGDSIRQAVAATVLMVLAVLSARGAAAGPARARYVPDEIIVKLRALRADETDSTETAIARDKLRVLSGLDQQGLREFRPLVRGFRGRQTKLHESRDGRRTPATLSQQRLLRRSQRVRKRTARTDLGRLYRIRLDGQSDAGVERMLAALRRLPAVEYAERNSIVSICAEPNDPLYGSQWALAKINAAQAWATCHGSGDVVVAVADTGVDCDHRDLRANMWVNEAELHGVAGVDDDGNGYVDDIRGYNFIAGDSDPLDDSGHGTHCAGIIAACTDNGLDVAGLCWNARILPLKMLNDEGLGTVAEGVEAIYYAVANGADIISCSWGDAEDSRVLRDAVAYAYGEGVVLVAAAGNDHSNVPFYPAGYAEVIGVTATQSNDGRSYTSNFGSWVDVAAPGQGILSLRAAGTSAGMPADAFTTQLSGTSMAAPHVAGACALLLGANPFLAVDEVRQQILATVDPIDAGVCLSNGRLNAARALEAAVPALGVVGFDRDAYPEGSDVLIHLADRHLKDTGVQTVTVVTDAGDVELVTLGATALALGVFSAVLPSEDGVAVPGDGRIQAHDGNWITVEYLDADDRDGGTDLGVVGQARADYTAPAVLDVEIEPRGTLARVTVTTNEPTQIEVRYSAAGGDSVTSLARDVTFSSYHRVSLGPLARGVDYGLAVTVTDVAGNETVAERNDVGQVYSVRVDPNALLVPDMYRTIQTAIDRAQAGDTIWVADGTYAAPGRGPIDFKGKAIAVRSESGPEACIIDGNRRGPVVAFTSDEDGRSILDGFTITNGAWTDFGGGIYCSMSSPTISNCAFISNTAEEQGGGMYCGAGSNPTVIGSSFEDNRADAGGAVSIAGNAGPVFRQCLFFNNAAEFYGAALASRGAAVALANCTISGNEAGESGGGIWSDRAGSFRLDNCILWGNTDSSDQSAVERAQIEADPALVELNYSCVEGWAGIFIGVGSFGQDPLFADPENGDFHLRSAAGRWDSELTSWVQDTVTSPCIDAGNPGWPLGDEPLTVPDDPNNVRTMNVRINMGAYGGTVEASMAPRDWVLRADLTNDGIVGWEDLGSMTAAWLCSEDQQTGDLTRDGVVDAADLVLLALQWRCRSTRGTLIEPVQ